MRYFGENGVVLDELEDDQLKSELKPKLKSAALMPCLCLIAFTGQYAGLTWLDPKRAAEPLAVVALLLSASVMVIPGIVSFHTRAVEDGLLPVNGAAEPQHTHVPGALVVAAALVVSILGMAAKAFDTYGNEFVIDDAIGQVALVGVGIAFMVMILLPRFAGSRRVGVAARAADEVLGARSVVGRLVRLIGRFASRIDSWLVHIFAPMAGVTQTHWTTRHFVLLSYMCSGGILAWLLPAPFGFFPLICAFGIAIAVVRRWAWVEADREVTLRNPNYHREQLRVGVDQDLRDEALVGLLALLLLIPVGLRQSHIALGGDVFGMSAELMNDFRAWVSFFGVELVKAIPFVDWADIYGVESNPSIQNNSMAAHHVVFCARAIVDLLFLAALFQAITSSFKLAEHKRMFFNREINRLDPIVEQAEFEKLGKLQAGEWQLDDAQLHKFEHYDRISLSRLRIGSDPDSCLHAVASKLLAIQRIVPSSPEERFIEAVSAPDLVKDTVTSTFEQARAQDLLPFEFLPYALARLNNLGPFLDFKRILVREMTRYPRTPSVVTAFREFAHGPRADLNGAIRVMAVGVLKEAALESPPDPRAKRTLRRMAEADASKIVRREAQQALDEMNRPRTSTPAVRPLEPA